MKSRLMCFMCSLNVIGFFIFFISASSVCSQDQQQKTKPTVTVTRTDGRVITGTIASQDSAIISVESDGMLISIPTASIASIAYDTNKETTAFGSISSAEDVLRALRSLAVANDTGVSLINFGPMLVQAKTDSVEPLRKMRQDTEFVRAVKQSLEAYQHALDAWQNKITSEFVLSSTDYGKWAIATYNVKKHGLFKTVFFEEVRQAALSRGRNYFQQAEALALEMQKSPLQVPAASDGRVSNTPFSTSAAPLVGINQATLTGRWIVEVTAPDSGKRETFIVEVDARAQGGRVSAFAGASLIESITTDLGESNLYVITTKPEKINKKQGQVVIRLRFVSENRLAGMLQLRRLSDGGLTPEATLTATRARD